MYVDHWESLLKMQSLIQILHSNQLSNDDHAAGNYAILWAANLEKDVTILLSQLS